MTDDEKAALADVYERAADHIENNGWWGSRCRANSGREACMAVAVNRVKGEVSLVQAITFIRDALELNRDKNLYLAIFEWNDDPDRTVDEVINTLHALANKLR